MALEPAGAAWCAKFLGSKSVGDCVMPFRADFADFMNAAVAAGADVVVTATYRPPQRAYLMHYAWGIAHRAILPGAVPPYRPASDADAAGRVPVDIDWTCGGNFQASIRAAFAMMDGYGLKVQAVLVSRHTQRRAVDCTIRWMGALAIKECDYGAGELAAPPKVHRIVSEPRDGNNAELAKVAATYGVIKLVGDDPHWSDDGH